MISDSPPPTPISSMPPLRLAMWSGPRNISTAMMRAWENRSDTFVVDEPLYAYYLTRVEVNHPGREEVIARHESDWRKVVGRLVGAIPGGKSVFYQKHMAHHLLPEVERDWLDRVTNCFLIRQPAEMLVSLASKMGVPRLGDTGLPQQVEIFRQVRRRTGVIPLVLDAADVLRQPRGLLQRFCQALGVPFTERMLSWPPGPRDSDGVWGKYWYHAVERSTGFEAQAPRSVEVPRELRGLLRECTPYYQELHAQRLCADD